MFNDKYEIETIKERLDSYLSDCGIDTSRTLMSCPVCGDKDGFRIVPNTYRMMWKCFSAKHSYFDKDGGDIFTLVQQMENTDFKGALEILKNKYNLGLGTRPTPSKPRVYTKPQPTQEELDYKEEERKYIEGVVPFAMKYLRSNDYLVRRGISWETQEAYNVGYVAFIHPKTIWQHRNEPNWTPQHSAVRMILPTSNSSLIARAVYKRDEGENGKYKIMKVGETHIFNADILKQSVGYCYVFEGEIDALSAIECGYNAVGLGSTSMIDKLFKEYELNKDVVLILALDNDEGGKTTTPKAVELCKANQQPNIVADSEHLFDGAKDCNQALQEDRATLTERLEEYKQQAISFDKETFRKENETLVKEKEQRQQQSFDYSDLTDEDYFGVKHYDKNAIGRIDRAKDLANNSLKYCYSLNKWYEYDAESGVLQANKKNCFIDDLQRNILSHMRAEQADYRNSGREDAGKVADKFEREITSAVSEKGLQETLKGLARQKEVAVLVEELDNPNLINLRDTTFDVSTMQPIPHSIDNLCTKQIDADLKSELDPTAVKIWNKFISDIMCGRPEMIEYLQRVCGYILEPTNKEECFFVLYGNTTRNGKSTLLNAIQGLFGDYAKSVSNTTLAETKSTDGPKPEILDLKGAKLITCGELNAETLLNDTLLKLALGRDLIKARGMHSDNMIQFYVDGKIFANCNELPPMRNDDMLNSNRIVVIPFNRHFEEHEQNKNLKELFSRPEYKAVIWQWVYQGYLAYKEKGIKADMPKLVKDAIRGYQSEANSVNVFLNDDDFFERIEPTNYEECVKLDKNGMDVLYPKYVEMCKESNMKPLSKPKLKKQLQKNRAYKLRGIQYTIEYRQCLCGYKLKPSFTYTSIDGKTTVIQR